MPTQFTGFSPPAQAKMDLLYVSMASLPNLDMSHKWDSTVCGALWLVSFTEHVWRGSFLSVTSLVVKWLRHQASTAQVLSPAGELRSHMLHGTVKKLKEKKKNLIYLYGHIIFHCIVNYILLIHSPIPQREIWGFLFLAIVTHVMNTCAQVFEQLLISLGGQVVFCYDQHHFRVPPTMCVLWTLEAAFPSSPFPSRLHLSIEINFF